MWCYTCLYYTHLLCNIGRPVLFLNMFRNKGFIKGNIKVHFSSTCIIHTPSKQSSGPSVSASTIAATLGDQRTNQGDTM